MDAVQAAYESAKDRLGGMTLAQFSEATKDCEVHPVRVHGEIAGAVLVKGAEVHACVLPWAAKRWVTRPLLRVLNSIIQQHGYAKTSATTASGREFVERLGFVKRGQEYRKEVPYGH